jgi:hypothetical protein
MSLAMTTRLPPIVTDPVSFISFLASTRWACAMTGSSPTSTAVVLGLHQQLQGASASKLLVCPGCSPRVASSCSTETATKSGKLEDVCVDVESDEPVFGTV